MWSNIKSTFLCVKHGYIWKPHPLIMYSLFINAEIKYFTWMVSIYKYFTEVYVQWNLSIVDTVDGTDQSVLIKTGDLISKIVHYKVTFGIPESVEESLF